MVLTAGNLDVKIIFVKVTIDKQKCIGCGTCASIAPKSFKLADDGKAEVVEPIGDSEAKIKEVVGSCAVEAIKVK